MLFKIGDQVLNTNTLSWVNMRADDGQSAHPERLGMTAVEVKATGVVETWKYFGAVADSAARLFLNLVKSGHLIQVSDGTANDFLFSVETIVFAELNVVDPVLGSIVELKVLDDPDLFRFDGALATIAREVLFTRIMTDTGGVA